MCRAPPCSNSTAAAQPSEDVRLIPQLGTLLRSKRKIEELSTVIQEQRRQTGH